MEKEILFDRIDAYIWHLLSDDERKAFENEAATDADLSTEIALRRIENEALQLADKEQLRTKMKAWRAEEALENPHTETKVAHINQGHTARLAPLSIRRWAAAAAVALLVLVGGRYWANAHYGNAVLVSEFYNKTSDNRDLFGASGDAKIDAPTLLAAADTAFQAKNYEQATTLYQTILAEKTVGLNYQEEAEWKLLMTDMAAHKTGADFQNLLTKLVDEPNHGFHKSALALKEKVNSFWWKIAE